MRSYKGITSHNLVDLMGLIQASADEGYRLIAVTTEPPLFQDEPRPAYTAFLERDHIPCCAVCNAQLGAAMAETTPPPTKRTARAPKSTSILPPGFLQFWAAYPSSRKISRKMCLTLWTRGNHEKDAEYIISHLEACKKSAQWQDPSKIPHASTYINQVRWQEEAPEPVKVLPVVPFAQQMVKDNSGKWVTQMTMAIATRAIGGDLTKQQKELLGI